MRQFEHQPSRISSALYGRYIELRSILARNDVAYPAMIRAISVLRPRQRTLLVDKTTDLVIEGFQRSANTFVLAAFEEANSQPLRIATHLHESYQVRFAERLHIPCIILVRNPLDATVSAIMREPRFSPSTLLRVYSRFYSDVLAAHRNALVVPFHVAVSNPNAVIGELNQIYGTSFEQLPIQSLPKVHDRVRNKDKRDLGDGSQDTSRQALPSEQKRLVQSTLKQLVRTHYGRLLATANAQHDLVASLGPFAKAPPPV